MSVLRVSGCIGNEYLICFYNCLFKKDVISPGKNRLLFGQHRSRHRSASLTTEAALAFPVLFFGIYMLWQCFLLLLFQLSLCSEVSAAAMKYAHLGYAEHVAEEKNVDISWLYQPLLWNSVPESDRVENLVLLCLPREDGAIEVNISYQFVCEGIIFSEKRLPVQQTLQFYPYLGVQKEDLFSVAEEKDVVYMTEHGTVYHESRACTYLTVTVRRADADKVEQERNSSGRKYKECERCRGEEQTESVYVSSGGTKFHWSLQCPALKRNVIEKTRDEVEGIPGCHKCVE